MVKDDLYVTPHLQIRPESNHDRVADFAVDLDTSLDGL